MQQFKSRLQSETFRKYITGTSWLLLEKVFSMGIAFAVGTITANQLGSEDYGKFNYARSFATLITVFAPLGISGGILARNLLNNPEKRDLIMGTAFATRLITSFFCVALATLVGFYMNEFVWNDDLKFWMVILAATPVVFESFNVLGDYFVANVESKYHAYGEFAKTLVSSAIKLVMLYVFDSPVIWFAVVLIVDAIIYDLVVIGVYARKFKLSVLQWKASRSYAWELIRETWPLVFSSFVIMIYMKIDQIMIQPMLGDKAVGLYAAALRISESTYFVPTVISSSLFPAIVNARKESMALFNDRTQQLSDLMVLIGILIAVPVTVLSHWIFKFLYAPEYADAQYVLVIHIWSGVMVGTGLAGNAWLTANGLQKFALYRTIWGAIANIVANMVLIPRVGIEGAAIATLIAQTIASYLGNAFSPKTRPLFFIQTQSLLGLGFLSPIKSILSKNR